MRTVLFYSDVESFNFFADQLEKEFQRRGHEIFIWDLRNPPAENPHSTKHFQRFASRKVDLVICFDGIGSREDNFIQMWNIQQAVVANILMDPPFRFHPDLLRHPDRYLLFCCDREHVVYVKKYFSASVPFALFMPHAGVLPEESGSMIPFAERKYDILFTATYYRPAAHLKEAEQLCAGSASMSTLLQMIYDKLTQNSDLTMEQAVLHILKQKRISLKTEGLLSLLRCTPPIDWAIRMYHRERVVTALAKTGFELYLLGRGWENHPCAGCPNVHHIADRIPYHDTLSYMADARINLNVMPWFKAGTHDRIFNTLLQHSVPLTDPSLWLTQNFTDGEDIAFYDLDHLEQLPAIAARLLTDTERSEAIIQKGYEKTSSNLTWSHCTDWILEAVNAVYALD